MGAAGSPPLSGTPSQQTDHFSWCQLDPLQRCRPGALAAHPAQPPVCCPSLEPCDEHHSCELMARAPRR
eukprot:6114747-Alexandrium_andersonii.AAC.1